MPLSHCQVCLAPSHTLIQAPFLPALIMPKRCATSILEAKMGRGRRGENNSGMGFDSVQKHTHSIRRCLIMRCLILRHVCCACIPRVLNPHFRPHSSQYQQCQGAAPPQLGWKQAGGTCAAAATKHSPLQCQVCVCVCVGGGGHTKKGGCCVEGLPAVFVASICCRRDHFVDSTYSMYHCCHAA